MKLKKPIKDIPLFLSMEKGLASKIVNTEIKGREGWENGNGRCWGFRISVFSCFRWLKFANGAGEKISL